MSPGRYWKNIMPNRTISGQYFTKKAKNIVFYAFRLDMGNFLWYNAHMENIGEIIALFCKPNIAIWKQALNSDVSGIPTSRSDPFGDRTAVSRAQMSIRMFPEPYRPRPPPSFNATKKSKTKSLHCVFTGWRQVKETNDN